MINVDNNDMLRCPTCGDTNTHIRLAYAAFRKQEDGPIADVWVGSNRRGKGPTGRGGEGRRGRFALLGDCENGHDFSVVFTQHKGNTFVETVTK